MSNSNRHDRYALIALVSALAAVVLVVWLTQPPGGPVDAPDAGNIEQYQNGDVAKLVAAIRDFSPWEDTFAQWIMAIFTIAATGVSLYAVRLVNDTLETARQANALMRADKRPWIKIAAEPDGPLNIGNGDKSVLMNVKIDITNVGEKPAVNVLTQSAIMLADFDFGYRFAMPQFLDVALKRQLTSAGQTIFPSDTIGANAIMGQKIERVFAPPGSDPSDTEFFFIYCVTYKELGFDTLYHSAQIYQIVPKATDAEHGWRLARISKAQSIS